MKEMSTGLFYFAGEIFGECEQSVLTLIGLFFTSLSHDKEVKRRKRA
jgi:hypothetical protein